MYVIGYVILASPAKIRGIWGCAGARTSISLDERHVRQLIIHLSSSRTLSLKQSAVTAGTMFCVDDEFDDEEQNSMLGQVNQLHVRTSSLHRLRHCGAVR